MAYRERSNVSQQIPYSIIATAYTHTRIYIAKAVLIITNNKFVFFRLI